MNRITHWFVAAATCLLAVCTSVASAATTEVGGVKFESPIELAGTKLQLNGAGVRHKAVFQVYAAGLYLTQKANTPEEALAAPGPKRISITMLRSIDSAELGKLFTRGVEDNSPRAARCQNWCPAYCAWGKFSRTRRRCPRATTL